MKFSQTLLRRRSKLSLEPLENRFAPAITTLFNPLSGLLSITITAGEAVAVDDAGGDNIIDINGANVGGADVSAVSAINITVSGAAGADITIDPGNNVAAFDYIPLTFLGGDGNDRFDGGNVALSGLTLTGGAGADTLIGGGDADILIETRDADMALTDTALTIGLEGTDNLSGIEEVSLTGGAGSNSFTATNWTLSATLAGAGGNDSFTVNWLGSGSGLTNILDSSGLDTLTTNGTAGADVVTASNTLVARATELVFFSGIDQIIVSTGDGNDMIDATTMTRPLAAQSGAGSDTIVGGWSPDDLDGGTGDDSLGGGLGDDTLNGGDGNDTFVGGLDDDSMAGGAGTDSLVETNDADLTLTDTSLTGIGNDTLSGFEKVLLTGGAIGNRIDASGFSGDVTLVGLGGDDTLFGGSGPDSLVSADGNDLLDGGGANDTLDGGNENDTLAGGDGNDVLESGAGADSLTGGTGNDTISSGADNDTLTGGTGTDSMVAGTGIDLLTETRDADFIFNNSRLTIGSEGADTLNGFENASLTGGAGDNVFTATGWTTNATLDGGEGSDRLILQANANMVLTDTTLTVSTGGLFSLISIEDASLTGGTGNNVLDARTTTRPVTLDGGAGNDSLLGGWADDWMIGGDGNDFINGYEGSDTADFSRSARGVTVNLNARVATAKGQGNDVLPSIENVVGSNANDNIVGNFLCNILDGLRGNDVIRGGGGADIVDGGDGNDRIYGDEGTDSLSGGNGNDTIYGGSGNDTLWGDAGTDKLYGETGFDFLYAQAAEQRYVYLGGSGRASLTNEGVIFWV